MPHGSTDRWEVELLEVHIKANIFVDASLFDEKHLAQVDVHGKTDHFNSALPIFNRADYQAGMSDIVKNEAFNAALDSHLAASPSAAANPGSPAASGLYFPVLTKAASSLLEQKDAESEKALVDVLWSMKMTDWERDIQEVISRCLDQDASMNKMVEKHKLLEVFEEFCKIG